MRKMIMSTSGTTIDSRFSARTLSSHSCPEAIADTGGHGQLALIACVVDGELRGVHHIHFRRILHLVEQHIAHQEGVLALDHLRTAFVFDGNEFTRAAPAHRWV